MNKQKIFLEQQSQIGVGTEGKQIYPRPELPSAELNKIVRNIKNKIPEDESSHLDVSIIEAYLNDLLFLGKLEELDKVVKKGRGEIRRFVDGFVQKILGESAKKNVAFQKSLRTILDDLKIDEDINDYMNRFTGQRFAEEINRQWNNRLEIWTHSHFMTVMTRAISDKFTKNEKVDERQLKSIGTLFFDLDGLKFLNEVSGYNAGDKALWVMARALTDPKLIHWAEQNGIELVPSHHHGDEFLVGIIAEDGIDLTNNNNTFIGIDNRKIKGISLLKYIGDYITGRVNDFGQQDNIERKERRKELTNSYAVSGSVGQIAKYTQDKRKNQVNPPKSIKDIIDFSNPKQFEKLAEFKAQLPAELSKLLDSQFKYQLSCSYGYSTLEDAVAKNVQDGLDFNNPDISYEYLVYKLTGKGLVDSSEAKLKIAKELGREMRRQSNNLKSQLLERLYRFGRETDRNDEKLKESYLKIARELIKMELKLQELLQKLQDLEEKNKKLKTDIQKKDEIIEGLRDRLGERARMLGRMWEWFDEKGVENKKDK